MHAKTPSRKPLITAALCLAAALCCVWMLASASSWESVVSYITAMPLIIGMAAEAVLVNSEKKKLVNSAAAAHSAGEVVQLPNGRAAYVSGLNGPAIGDEMTLEEDERNVVDLQFAASVVALEGGDAYWDRSASKCTPLKADGDFRCGIFAADAASGDTTCRVRLNAESVKHIELGKRGWTTEATDGLGVARVGFGNEFKLAFDAVAEVAQAAMYSDETVAVADNPVFFGELAIYDIGDDAALDISFGLANGSHATDFDSVTEAVIIHLDGNALDILAESDDGTTEVAATDTTVDAVDNTYFEFWIDARDLTDIKLYIDGVAVLTGSTFKLDAATGPLKAIVHIEKTSNDTTADVRVKRMDVISSDDL